ncbi:MAG TPA: glycosyltransferase family 4 protein [Mucilaginibacter sp.]|nr:glycosyltransferase family 4 protein [Mucilaginibacter sp.]
MRILLIMDPGIPVPPTAYGGHERLVYLFAEEYIKMGHEVTVLAGPGSHCSGKTVTFGVNNLDRSKLQRYREVIFVWRYLRKNKDNFDLVHNFGRLAYLLPILNHPVKKIMTYGRPVAQKGIKKITSRRNQNLVFTACSDYCVSTGNVAGKWKTVYNAIDFSQYRLREEVAEDAPLMFLGRLDRVKGAHTAIKVARATGDKLVIGGNVSHTPDNYAYFKQEIEPQVDGIQIIYHGPMDDEAKNKYLGMAKALLFPIEWDEPFGMVMAEAMACGTPVIAFNRGSVPEVVTDKTGIIVQTADEMAGAVRSVGEIDRKACREEARKRFDVPVIAAEYLKLFEE